MEGVEQDFLSSASRRFGLHLVREALLLRGISLIVGLFLQPWLTIGDLSQKELRKQSDLWSTPARAYVQMYFLRNFLWKSDLTVSLDDRFLALGSLLAWFLKILSSYHRLFKE